MIHWRASHLSLASSRSRLMCPSPFPPCPSYLGWFLPTYPVPSIRRKLKSVGLCGTSNWQPRFPFMGVVGDSTTGPFFIDWFSFLGIRRRFVILIKGDLGLFDIWTLLYSFYILPLVISWPVLSRLHPHSQLFDNSVINTFTLFSCLSMVILILWLITNWAKQGVTISSKDSYYFLYHWYQNASPPQSDVETLKESQKTITEMVHT